MTFECSAMRFGIGSEVEKLERFGITMRLRMLFCVMGPNDWQKKLDRTVKEIERLAA